MNVQQLIIATTNSLNPKSKVEGIFLYNAKLDGKHDTIIDLLNMGFHLIGPPVSIEVEKRGYERRFTEWQWFMEKR